MGRQLGNGELEMYAVFTGERGLQLRIRVNWSLEWGDGCLL